jgi:hypothetical protein
MKMVHLLFAMIDMKPNFATSTFNRSILGTRLSIWSQLPGLIPINSLWNAHSTSATFYWFNSLQELLHIFHCWIKAQRFHLTQGFTTATDSQGAANIVLVDTLPSHIPGQLTHLMEAVTRYDTKFQQRWYTQAFTISDPLWTLVLPADHFVRSHIPPPVQAPASQPPASTGKPASKRIKLGKSGKSADFICTTTLIVPVGPLLSQKAVITTILHRLLQPGCFLTLPDENGTLSYICFQSCFAAPHDHCVTKKCVHQKATPPILCLHIDISVDFWKRKPETYWTSLVE